VGGGERGVVRALEHKLPLDERRHRRRSGRRAPARAIGDSNGAATGAGALPEWVGDWRIRGDALMRDGGLAAWPIVGVCRSPAPIRGPPRGPAPRTRCATAPRALRRGEQCGAASSANPRRRSPPLTRSVKRQAAVIPGDDSTGTDRHLPRRRSDRPHP
jgi:hypothetical protein